VRLKIWATEEEATCAALEWVLGEFYTDAAGSLIKAINAASFTNNYSFTAYWGHQKQLWATTVVLHVHGTDPDPHGIPKTPEDAAKDILSQHPDVLAQPGLLQEHVSNFPYTGIIVHSFDGLTTVHYMSLAPGEGSTITVTRAAGFHGNHPLTA
jgi:hypothetical protein